MIFNNVHMKTIFWWYTQLLFILVIYSSYYIMNLTAAIPLMLFAKSINKFFAFKNFPT